MDDREVVVPGERWLACLLACLLACCLENGYVSLCSVTGLAAGRVIPTNQPEQRRYIFYLFSFSLYSPPVLPSLFLPALSILCPRPICPYLPGTVALAFRCLDWETGRSSNIPPSRRRSPSTSRILSRVSAGQFILVLLQCDDKRYQRSLYVQ